MKNLTVKNIENNGKSVPNQFIICYKKNNKKYKIFQSYASMILKWENEVLIEDEEVKIFIDNKILIFGKGYYNYLYLLKILNRGEVVQ